MSAFHCVCVTVLVYLSFTKAADKFCSDIDENACNLLKQTLPDMCADSCFADVCKKTCNMCPLVCYQCNREFYPEMCKKKIQCNDTQLCVASQELSVDFLPLYVSGCMEKQTCLDIFGEINRRSTLIYGPKRDYALNGSCCNFDLCNEHDLQNAATVDPSVQKPTAAPVQYDDLCELSDLDTDMCRNLSRSDPNMCSRSCFAQKICPITCGSCRRCYKCVNVNDPSSCVRSQTCTKNQQCIVLHTLDNNFNPTYKLGCADTNICQVYFGGAGTVSGNRRADEGLVGHCCDKDYCNGPPPTTTTITTSVQSQSTQHNAASHSHPTSHVHPSPHSHPTKDSRPTSTSPSVTQTTEFPSTQTIPTQTVPPQTTFAPDPACKDVVNNCAVVSQNILCNTNENASLDYAIKYCPSTCRLCKEYEAWKNSQVSTTPVTTPFPCVDVLPSCSVYGPVFCLDSTPSTRTYVIQYCALTCNLCKEYFQYKQQHASVTG
ncbi:uncharacterized protein LOC125677190 [Ostrea edulis]|uniref:uncharacterized protein LOC125677190 n=1 Tax=Ostrea edulis TaxID=37623 RepID=UPI0020949000|nr:uncharacterized protein LOC125677190 [Ostrea edulis]